MKSKMKYLVVVSILIGMYSCKNDTKNVSQETLFQGYVESTQVNVTTRMPGRLTKIFVDEGDTLLKGDTVATLDVRELKANREILVTKLRYIEINKKRSENLYQAGAIPKQKLDEITTGYDMLKAKIRALDIRINDMTILAPMNGIVNVKVLEPNQMMPPGFPVVIETNPENTWARFSIPETYLSDVNLGDVFTLKTNSNTEFKAKVFQIVPIAEFATHTPTTTRDERDVRTFDVKMLIVNNQLSCKPGMSVYLNLKSEVKKGYSSKK